MVSSAETTFEFESEVTSIVYDLIVNESREHTPLFYSQLDTDLGLLESVMFSISSTKEYRSPNVKSLRVVLQRIKIYEYTMEYSEIYDQELVRKLGSLFFPNEDIYTIVNSIENLTRLMDCIRSIFVLSELDAILSIMDESSKFYDQGLTLLKQKEILYNQLKQNISKSV